MLIHVVQKGDTLWKIARQYGISFEELKKVNAHLANPDYIVPGMKLFVPKDEKEEMETESLQHPFQNDRPVKEMKMPPKQPMPQTPQTAPIPQMPHVPNMPVCPPPMPPAQGGESENQPEMPAWPPGAVQFVPIYIPYPVYCPTPQQAPMHYPHQMPPCENWKPFPM